MIKTDREHKLSLRKNLEESKFMKSLFFWFEIALKRVKIRQKLITLYRKPTKMVKFIKSD